MTTAMNEAEKLAERLRDIVTKYRFVSHEHGVIDGAASILRRQAEQIKVLREALEEAASSLTYIANTACKRDEELMSDAINVRGYARSRASVVDAALAATKEET